MALAEAVVELPPGRYPALGSWGSELKVKRELTVAQGEPTQVTMVLTK